MVGAIGAIRGRCTPSFACTGRQQPADVNSGTKTPPAPPCDGPGRRVMETLRQYGKRCPNGTPTQRGTGSEAGSNQQFRPTHRPGLCQHLHAPAGLPCAPRCPKSTRSDRPVLGAL